MKLIDVTTASAFGHWDYEDIRRLCEYRDRLKAELENLKEAAGAVAILALQGNDYHRGNKDFKDAVDDLMFLQRIRRKHAEKSP